MARLHHPGWPPVSTGGWQTLAASSASRTESCRDSPGCASRVAGGRARSARGVTVPDGATARDSGRGFGGEAPDLSGCAQADPAIKGRTPMAENDVMIRVDRLSKSYGAP